MIRRLQPKLDAVAGITLYMQPVQDLSVEDRVSRTQFQYTLEDASADELNVYTPRMIDKLKQIPYLRDVASDQQVQGLRANLDYDRNTALRLGITPNMIDQTLYDAYGQREVSVMFTQLNQYHVVLELMPGFQRSPADLRDLYIRTGTGSQAGSTGLVSGGNSSTSLSTGPKNSAGNAATSIVVGAGATPSSAVFNGNAASASAFPNGGQVALGTFSQVQMQSAPITINHQGQFPVVTISFNLAPDASLGDAVNAVNRVKDELQMPASIQGAFQGTAASFQASLANEPVLILAALVTVYIVLGVLYESYIHPMTILSTLPSAGVGAILALLICRNDFSIVALIGIVLLIGIVQKNAIMMIDFALDAERKEGMAPLDAIYRACSAALPPDPDDDDGGDARRRAAGVRHGYRIGTAPSAGHHDHRRIDLQPDANPVYDARDLSLDGAPCAPVIAA